MHYIGLYRFISAIRSFWQPFVILLKIPIDFTGTLIELLITRQSLRISVGIAFLTLVGISVNNAIVLLDFANRTCRKRMNRTRAIRNAVHIRTPPILMTGLITIFALISEAIGGGVGSKFYLPFAIALIGGLMFGVMFSLNVIPALYDGFASCFQKQIKDVLMGAIFRILFPSKKILDLAYKIDGMIFVYCFIRVEKGEIFGTVSESQEETPAISDNGLLYFIGNYYYQFSRLVFLFPSFALF